MTGKVVVVTGGSSGIGLAAAGLFSRRGDRVWLVARDPARLEAAATSIGTGVRTIPADVGDPASLLQLRNTLEREEGRIDVLVNSAGQMELMRAEDICDGIDIAERLVRVNYLGTARVTSALLPLIRAGETRSIVNLSTWAAKISPPFMAAYSASKFALTAYTHALRQELRHEGFHVGLVLPGPVATAMIADRIETPMYPRPFGVPIVPPEAVARAILRCSDRRRSEVFVPGHFALLMRLGSAFPGLVDAFYARYVRKTS
jgi:short-subunit dehydrogenase